MIRKEANCSTIEMMYPGLWQFCKEHAPGLNSLDRLLRCKGGAQLLGSISERSIKKFLPEGMRELARDAIKNPQLYELATVVIPLRTDSSIFPELLSNPQALRPKDLVVQGHNLDQHPPDSCTRGTTALIGDKENYRLIGILALDSGIRTWDSLDPQAQRNFLKLFRNWLFAGLIAPLTFKAWEEIPGYAEQVFILMEDGFSPERIKNIAEIEMKREILIPLYS